MLFIIDITSLFDCYVMFILYWCSSFAGTDLCVTASRTTTPPHTVTGHTTATLHTPHHTVYPSLHHALTTPHLTTMQASYLHTTTTTTHTGPPDQPSIYIGQQKSSTSSHTTQGRTSDGASTSASLDHNALFWHQFGHHHLSNEAQIETDDQAEVKVKRMVTSRTEMDLSEDDSGIETQDWNNVKVQSSVTKESEENLSRSDRKIETMNQNKVKTQNSLTIEANEAKKPEENDTGRTGATPNPSQPSILTHVTTTGEARMVDVSGKAVTRREAVARAEVALGAVAFQLVKENRAKKGDVLGVARIAGIMAAKRTSELIPLCHSLPLDKVEVNLMLRESQEAERSEKPVLDHVVVIEARAVTTGRTGVEMEALVAASIAALTVYDMCKAVSHDITISQVRLFSKSGGKRDYIAKF